MKPWKDFDREELRALNSATQYPSIKTYHVMGDKGRLTEELNVDFDDIFVEVTEKIDGVNARVLIPPDGESVIVGSRTELLYFQGDVLHNPAEGIVDTLYPMELDLPWALPSVSDNILVIWGEVFGSCVSTPGRKQYTSTGQSNFRIFDAALIAPHIVEWPIERIASWRDGLGQMWSTTAELTNLAKTLPWSRVPLISETSPPKDVANTYNWLCDTVSYTWVALDEDAPGKPEGVVVRTRARSRIAKIRFEDYERTLGTGRFEKGSRSKAR